jgi:hypothetical protein
VPYAIREHHHLQLIQGEQLSQHQEAAAICPSLSAYAPRPWDLISMFRFELPTRNTDATMQPGEQLCVMLHLCHEAPPSIRGHVLSPQCLEQLLASNQASIQQTIPRHGDTQHECLLLMQ